jgi:hypothetical protein
MFLEYPESEHLALGCRRDYGATRTISRFYPLAGNIARDERRIEKEARRGTVISRCLLEIISGKCVRPSQSMEMG